MGIIVSMQSLPQERREALLDLVARIKLIASIVVGLEEAVGVEQASGFANLVASSLYRELGLGKAKTVSEALEKLNRETVYRLDTYTTWSGLVRDEGDRGKAFYLIARECPIRQILYQEDLPAGRSLCRIMCALLEKLFSEKLRGKFRVTLQRYGPNACLLRVGVYEALEPIDFSVVSRKPSVEEYLEKLREIYDAILRAVDEALHRLLGDNPAMSYRTGKAYGRIEGRHILVLIGSTTSLEEAIKAVNKFYHGVLELRLEGGKLAAVRSRLHDIVAKSGMKYGVSAYRAIQGLIAGILSVLTGKSIDLRVVDEASRTYRVISRG